MKRKSLAIATSLVLIMVTLACQLITGNRPPAATPTPEATEIPIIVEPTEAPIDNSIAETLAAADENAQATLESAQSTETAAAKAFQETAAAEETATAAESLIQTETAQVDTIATAQAQEFANVIDDLAKQGLLENTAGMYSMIEDFNENWAQIGWYQWWETGFEPSNFVIRARTEWESASKTANSFDSGCGFVFREEDENNHYMIFLALDGNVYMRGYVDGVYKEFGKGYAGKIDHLKGGADVMLAAEGNRILYFVNGEKVLDREVSSLNDGKLALTLVSGTNKDFGTRCSISEIELWELEE